MTTAFTINNSCLHYEELSLPFEINSFPRPYTVTMVESLSDYQALVLAADFIIIDERVADLYSVDAQSQPSIFKVRALEENKSMQTVLDILNAFIDNNISKGSRVLAIGGGIIQDLAACACALFRRGQPFTYFPTTTLGQLDSCVGAKCAVNTPKAKNIIGLFSAPSEVIIPAFMIETMPLIDHRAGLSEMLRLCLTASSGAVSQFMHLFPSISSPAFIDLAIYKTALALSLSIKKAVVDYDEYERDVRRSMNYGHTFGHAIEKLTDYSLPHGLAVLLGMHMANTFSLASGFMTESTYLAVTKAIKMTIAGVPLNQAAFFALKPQEIVDQFRYDKKGDGESLPLILIKHPGNMLFYRYRFDSTGEGLLEPIRTAMSEFLSWTAQ